MSRAEMDALGWAELDVLLVTGDAYVDHPSFGVPLLGRLLASRGHRVGICAQPRWDVVDDVAAMGRPRLFAGAAAGALDSLLAHYTAFRKKRHDDAYTPGGRAGKRPNRAVTVYANLLRRAFPGLPVVVGGIEASLRRVSHYDFWTDALRRSVLLDAKADLLVYGMGERALLETARRLAEAADEPGPRPPELLAGILGTAVALAPERAQELAFELSGATPESAAPTAEVDSGDDAAPNAASPNAATPDAAGPDTARADAGPLFLPSHEEILADPRKLLTATLALERQVHQGARWAVQEAGGRAVLVAPPAPPLSTGELDALYDLPFTRLPHPAYAEPIPAWGMIKGSITSHRGCAGGCSFCALALHQGRRIRSRSRASILREAERLATLPWFDGSISDVGGPSGNMWNARCAADPAACRRASCLTPRPCRHFLADQRAGVELLRAVRALPGVRHLRLASGMRLDLALTDEQALRDYVAEFTGGQLKVAPEHFSDKVLRLMRKPSFAHFERLCTLFDAASRRAGKEQYIVPYLMSAFPGCTDADMRDLGDWLARRGWRPRQVQCFIPLPGTVAAALFFAGCDEGGAPIPVARTDAERLRQHAVLAPEIGARGRRTGGPKADGRPGPRAPRPAPKGAARNGRGRAK
ncbi:MAG: YgiQ family radical SAM protein [Desulfovibrionaceae bacterium]|jgi:uncharacterized radical SAM protein YgiQ|nr:YgiQ family radical SAM protein [Desulfovibrionaceae bacterium]